MLPRTKLPQRNGRLQPRGAAVGEDRRLTARGGYGHGRLQRRPEPAGAAGAPRHPLRRHGGGARTALVSATGESGSGSRVRAGARRGPF